MSILGGALSGKNAAAMGRALLCLIDVDNSIGISYYNIDAFVLPEGCRGVHAMTSHGEGSRSVPDQTNAFADFRPQNDRDLLVMLITQTRHINDGIREIRVILGDTQKELGALRLSSDRHERAIAQLEQKHQQRVAQHELMQEKFAKLEKDLWGRFDRIERERLDPLDDRISAVRHWIAGAVAVIVFLWVFLAPVYTRFIADRFGG